jgi:hypothetical protein
MATDSPRPHNVHDHFVCYIFCRPWAAAIMLRRALPADLLVHLDLEALALASPVYTDPYLRGRASDLGFSTRLVHGDTSVPAHISVEHQSNPDALHPLRRVVYGTDVWGRELRSRPHDVPPLTVIIPVVFLQYPARNTPIQLSSILDVPPALRDVVGNPFDARIFATDFSGSVLDDPVAPLHFRALVELACAFLHAYHNEHTLTDARLAELGPLFDIVLKHFGPDDILAFWTYITAVFEDGVQMCAKLMQSVSQPTREAYMTVQERWLAEGREQGLEQGLEQGRTLGKAEALLDVLELRQLPIPAPVREQVLATRDEHRLRSWLARVLTVASAEELVAAAET